MKNKAIYLFLFLLVAFLVSGATYITNTYLQADKLAIGTEPNGEIGVFEENKTGITRLRLKNTNNGSAQVVGAIFEVRNNANHWGAIGMTSNGSTILGGMLGDTYQNYNQGYGDFLFTNDGNVNFRWFSDPTDSHNFGALTNEIMRLDAQGNLNVTGNFTGNQIYGGFWYHNNSGVSFPFSANDTWYNFTGAECNGLNGIECDGGNGILTPLVSGMYKVDTYATGSGANNHLYHTTVLVDGVEQEQTEAHMLSSSGDVHLMANSGIIRVNANQKVTLAVKDTGGTSTGTVYNYHFIMWRIGD